MIGIIQRHIMKKLFLLLAVLGFCVPSLAQKHIRINYVGYLPKSIKVAVSFEEKSADSPLTQAEKLATQVSSSGQTAWTKKPGGVSMDEPSVTIQEGEEFVVFDAVTDLPAFTGKAKGADPSKWVMKEAARLDFSALEKPGGYYIRYKGAYSPIFKIGADVYDEPQTFCFTI